jgi:rootletin
MKERCDCLTKQLHTAESKCQNQQTTVERLSAALAKTEEGEEQLKERVNGLSKSVSNKQLVAQDLQDKVHKLQKLVTASEQDRTVLSERLENSRASIAELKKQMAKSNENCV